MMTYDDITLEKYQVMLHLVNEYAKKHDGVKPEFSYDPKEQTLEIGGISKPIVFQTNKLGLVPAGEYEVVGEVALSKDDTGKTDINGMNAYKPSIVNISNYPEVFDFIEVNHNSTSCACCGTNRERNNFFYIRRMDDPSHEMFQVGSTCVNNYFDRSYFNLMSTLSSIANESDRTVIRGKTKDCNLTQYIPAYLKERDKGKTIVDTHKKAVKSSSTGISSKSKNAFKTQINEILNFYRTHDVKDEYKAIFKTIQELARMLNGDANIDPYYSATRCKEIARAYESLVFEVDEYNKNKMIYDKRQAINTHAFIFNDIIDQITLTTGSYSEYDMVHLCLTDKGRKLLGDERRTTTLDIIIDPKSSVKKDIETIQGKINNLQHKCAEKQARHLAIDSHPFIFNEVVDRILWLDGDIIEFHIAKEDFTPAHGAGFNEGSMSVSLSSEALIEFSIERIQGRIDDIQKSYLDQQKRKEIIQNKKSVIETYPFVFNEVIDQIKWKEKWDGSHWIAFHNAKENYYSTYTLKIDHQSTIENDIEEIQARIDNDLQKYLQKTAQNEAKKIEKATYDWKVATISTHSFTFNDAIDRIMWEPNDDYFKIIFHLTENAQKMLPEIHIAQGIIRPEIGEVDPFIKVRPETDVEDTIKSIQKKINGVQSAFKAVQDKVLAIQTYPFAFKDMFDQITWKANSCASNVMGSLTFTIAAAYKAILDKSYIDFSIYYGDTIEQIIDKIQKKISDLQNKYLQAADKTQELENSYRDFEDRDR